MNTAVFVLAGADSGFADSGPTALPGAGDHAPLRATLNALWSEDPGCPADTVVPGDALACAVARREHGNRVQVHPLPEIGSMGQSLNELIDCHRHRCIVLLRPGAIPTPGWLYEMARVADDQDVVLVGPRLLADETEGVHAADAVLPLSRRELRRAATRLRFREPRTETVESLPTACICIPRRTLNRIGRFDVRYRSLGGVILDYQRRVRSWEGSLLLANRALVQAPCTTDLPAADRQALERRAPFFARAVKRCPAIALEIAPDDPEQALLSELADGLVERGLQLHTFSLDQPVTHRPSHASHVQTASLEAATRGAAMVLLRSQKAVSLPGYHLQIVAREKSGALHKRNEGAGDAPPCEGVLRLVDDPAGHPGRADQLDAWALEIFSAACGCAGAAPC